MKDALVRPLVGVCLLLAAACAPEEEPQPLPRLRFDAPNGGASGGAGSGAGIAGGMSGGMSGSSGMAGSASGAGGSAGAGASAGQAGAAGGSAGHSGSSGAASGGATAASGPCPWDMAQVGGEVCMDRFEAPNVLGALPMVMQTASEGEDFCKALGKRLCTDVEWNRACEGSQNRPYPYGQSWKSGTCNDEKLWKSPNWGVLASYPAAAGLSETERLYQAEPSGSFPGCVSEEGVFDLTGNVAEWVVRTLPTSKNYAHVLKGCYWSKCFGGANPNCGFVNGAHPGEFRTYEGGFRCCKNAQAPLP